MYRYVYDILNADSTWYFGLAAIVGAALSFWKATSKEFREFVIDLLKWLWRRSLGILRPRPSTETLRPTPPSGSVDRSFARLAWVLFVVFVVVLAGNLLPYDGTRNEYLTYRAWRAYEKGNNGWGVFAEGRWKDAIQWAQMCIDEFEPMAWNQQKDLTNEKVPEPKLEGLSEQEKESIFHQGLINDVAACHYIIGRASEKLTSKKLASERPPYIAAARAAYERTARFTHAAVWDRNGEFFWSPAKDARARLEAANANGDRK